MFEALVVAEFVVADLTLANPNVTYEIGVRHGVGQRNTILVCAVYDAHIEAGEKSKAEAALLNNLDEYLAELSTA